MLKMDDCISRKAVIKALENVDADVCEQYPDGYCRWGISRDTIKSMIENVPAADLEPVQTEKKGRMPLPEPMRDTKDD